MTMVENSSPSLAFQIPQEGEIWYPLKKTQNITHRLSIGKAFSEEHDTNDSYYICNFYVWAGQLKWESRSTPPEN